jgi:hypothetical protein
VLGCTVVRGAAQPFLMPGLFRNDSLFFGHASGTHLHARDAELLKAIVAGRALVGGLVGEGWTRLVSDEFAEAAPSAATAGPNRPAFLSPRPRRAGKTPSVGRDT